MRWGAPDDEAWERSVAHYLGSSSIASATSRTAALSRSPRWRSRPPAMADAARAPGSVLMTADTVGGVFSYAIELARALAARGVRTSLATLGGPLSAPQREAAGRVPGLAVFESSFRLEWMEDPWDDVARRGLAPRARGARPPGG